MSITMIKLITMDTLPDKVLFKTSTPSGTTSTMCSVGRRKGRKSLSLRLMHLTQIVQKRMALSQMKERLLSR